MRSKIMPAWRQVLELTIGGEDLSRLTAIARSRTEPASRVERARMLLAYREDPSFFAVGRALGAQTVQRCVERAVVYGPLAALDDRRSRRSRLRPRPGWCRWPVARPRNWAIRMSCGRRGCWPATRARMDQRQDMSVSPIWSKVRCARSSIGMK